MFRLAIVASVMLVTGLVSFGQGPEPKSRQETVTVWFGEVIGMGGVVVEGPLEFPSQEAADEWEKGWREKNRESFKLPKVYSREVPISRTSSPKKEPEFARPQGVKAVPGGAGAKDIIRVGVYKVVGGKLVEQRDKEQVFSIDDIEKASAFYWDVRSQEGYWARWYDAKGRKALIAGAKTPWVDVEGIYNKPRIDQPKGDSGIKAPTGPKLSDAEKKVVGSWRLGSSTKYILKEDYSGVWVSDGRKYADLSWSMAGDVVTVTTADRKVTWKYKSSGGTAMSLISENKFVSISIEKE